MCSQSVCNVIPKNSICVIIIVHLTIIKYEIVPSTRTYIPYLSLIQYIIAQPTISNKVCMYIAIIVCLHLLNMCMYCMTLAAKTPNCTNESIHACTCYHVCATIDYSVVVICPSPSTTCLCIRRGFQLPQTSSEGHRGT